jgi:hypothetical protein
LQNGFGTDFGAIARKGGSHPGLSLEFFYGSFPLSRIKIFRGDVYASQVLGHLLYQDVVFGEKASVRVYNRGTMGKAVRDNAVTRLGDDTVNRGNHVLVAKRVLIQANTVA